MRRHDFDPVSAFFGILIAGSALAVTLADRQVFDLDSKWVWPALLIVGGVMLIVSGTNRSSRD